MILLPLCRSFEDVGFGRAHLLAGSETLNTALRLLLSIYCVMYLYLSYIISAGLYSQEGHLPNRIISAAWGGGCAAASPSPCLETALGDLQVVFVHLFIPGFLFYSVLINLFIWRSNSA